MKKVRVEDIKGNEVAARDIVMSTGTIVIPMDSIIKSEYKERLIELGITEVYIYTPDNDSISAISSDEEFNNADIPLPTEIIIQEQCRENVRNTIEKYSYSESADLDNIADVAEKIMEDILSEPEIMYQVSGIRNKSESAYLHSINVSALSVLIAFKLGLDEKRVREIAVGALLHDIGIVFLPFEYKNERYNEEDEEFINEFKKHVITGYSVVENESWISDIAKRIIFTHHERCDGSGYPIGLKGNVIDLESKIVAVCDEFDDLVYGNYTKKRKVYEVIEYITSQAGVKFDFDVVRAFVASVAVYPAGTYVITNENEVGIVVRQNRQMPSRPVIRMLFNSKSEKYVDYVEKDLTKELTLFIKDTIEK